MEKEKSFLEKLADRIFGDSNKPKEPKKTMFQQRMEKLASESKTKSKGNTVKGETVKGDLTGKKTTTRKTTIKSNSNMSTITINGKKNSVSGKNIRVEDDKIYVDNVLVSEGLSGIVKIEFTGDLASLDCTTAKINGSIKGDVDCTTINCGDVEGNVDATTIHCLNVGGNVKGVTVNKRS